MVIHNHPYYGSSHSPDIAILVFHKGRLVAYSANTALHLDIGVATPGLTIDIPDVYAESMLLFAGTKLYEEGRRNEALWEDGGRECGILTRSLTLGSAQEWSNRTSWLIFDDRPGRRRARQRDGAALAGCFTCTPRQTGMSSAPCINALAHS